MSSFFLYLKQHNRFFKSEFRSLSIFGNSINTVYHFHVQITLKIFHSILIKSFNFHKQNTRTRCMIETVTIYGLPFCSCCVSFFSRWIFFVSLFFVVIFFEMPCFNKCDRSFRGLNFHTSPSSLHVIIILWNFIRWMHFRWMDRCNLFRQWQKDQMMTQYANGSTRWENTSKQKKKTKKY